MIRLIGRPVVMCLGLVMLISAAPQAAVAALGVPPTAPEAIQVTPPEGWHSTPDFLVNWRNPIGADPIAAAHYEMCRSQPLGGCTGGSTAGVDISEMYVSAPTPGLYVVRVWLEDSEGDVDPSARSSPVSLRFDNQIPAPPKVAHPDGWLNAQAPESLALAAELSQVGDPPLSGVSGYSFTTTGADPDDQVEAIALQDFDRYPATINLPSVGEGMTTLKVRAVSGAGVVSVTSLVNVRVDRTPPQIEAVYGGSLGTWLRDPVQIELVATDQEWLSGMTPAPTTDPVETGGHIAWALGDEEGLVRGSSADVRVEADGQHVLRFKAVDVAGNESVEREVAFKIDRTGPVGAFRARNVMDPTLLQADVSDAMSGLADGWIEFRRSGDGEFRRLPSVLRDGILSARVPDEGMADGRYEARAIVSDLAGNRTVIQAGGDGRPFVLSLPLRAGVALDVKAERVGAMRCVTVRKGRGKSRWSKGVCRRGPTRLVRSVAVGHGRKVVARGTLSHGGTPLAGARLEIQGRPSSGSTWAPIGVVTTDSRGEFRYVLPAGPSRTVQFRFPGTAALRPAVAAVRATVRAGVSLKVNRRRLLNGQAVRFTGRLPGRPLPPSGKLVALQAKVSGGWRTFATPRADSRGRFRHRYRFTATTGLRRYRFRAVVAAEPAYPYARGVSRTVSVTVRGR